MKIERILRIFIIFLGIYLIFDGSIFLFNIKLQSVSKVWPASALSYATVVDSLCATFIYLAAALAFIVQKDLKKYKSIISISSIWTFFQGLLLIYLNSAQNLISNFSNLPSLSVWMPFYQQYLLFEAFLCFIYTGLVLIWLKGEKK